MLKDIATDFSVRPSQRTLNEILEVDGTSTQSTCSEEESKVANSSWNGKDLDKKSSCVKNLSLIDCDIKGISSLLNQIGKDRL